MFIGYGKEMPNRRFSSVFEVPICQKRLELVEIALFIKIVSIFTFGL